jgi:hypothetical protein
MADQRTIVRRDGDQLEADPHPSLLTDRERLVADAEPLLAELATEAEGNVIMDKVIEIEARMATLPAATPSGALALARLAGDLMQGRVGHDPVHDEVVILAALSAVEATLAALVEPCRTAPGEVRH